MGKANELEGQVACTVTPEALARLSDDDLRAIVDVGTRVRAAIAAASATDTLAPASSDITLTTT